MYVPRDVARPKGAHKLRGRVSTAPSRGSPAGLRRRARGSSRVASSDAVDAMRIARLTFNPSYNMLTGRCPRCPGHINALYSEGRHMFLYCTLNCPWVSRGFRLPAGMFARQVPEK